MNISDWPRPALGHVFELPGRQVLFPSTGLKAARIKVFSNICSISHASLLASNLQGVTWVSDHRIDYRVNNFVSCYIMEIRVYS
jgi:hypothetical protein